MIKRLVFAGVAVSFSLVLAGCEETKRAFGFTKEGPDEFAVYRRAPLSMPPDFSLRPPSPGSKRPQLMVERDKVRAAIGGFPANKSLSDKSRNSFPGGWTKGELSVLTLTGADKVDPNIRRIVELKSLELFETSKSVTDKVIFWKRHSGTGTIVDPKLEQKRIREAQALGKPIYSNRIPTISQETEAIFEGIFE
ncbi:MAG: DUF3035 domain-containing protein [Pseudomonadota bacterium]|nr:DUF3035 domain-containing protein [Pseudomonadota bacterium]